MKRQFAVIGLGRFGASVAETLAESGYDVVGIDKSPEPVQEMSKILTEAVQADATDESALRQLGIENVDCCIVAIGVDIEGSVLVTMTLKDIGIREVVAKAITPVHGKILRKVGATKVVFPERDMGIRVAKSLISPMIFEQLQLSQDYGMIETIASKVFVGKTLRELDVRSRYGVHVIAIKRKKPEMDDEGESTVKDAVMIAPEAGEIIEEGDSLVLIGPNKELDRLK
jgi:trk system potassium uptake protein